MTKQMNESKDQHQRNIEVISKSNCYWHVYCDGQYVGHATRQFDTVYLFGPYGNVWEQSLSLVGWDPRKWIESCLA